MVLFPGATGANTLIEIRLLYDARVSGREQAELVE
jgi:hypothetical protein